MDWSISVANLLTRPLRNAKDMLNFEAMPVLFLDPQDYDLLQRKLSAVYSKAGMVLRPTKWRLRMSVGQAMKSLDDVANLPRPDPYLPAFEFDGIKFVRGK